MAFLRDAPIRTKLTAIIMAITSIALVLACAAFVTEDILSLRRKLVEDLGVVARIAGLNSSAALMFDDQDSANEVLGALRETDSVMRALLFDADQEVFASYQRPDVAGQLPPAEFQFTGSGFEDDSVFVYMPVEIDGEAICTVFLESDLRVIDARLSRSLGVLAVVLLGALLVALFLSSRLQQMISVPIRELARMTKAVSGGNDYSVRVEKRSDDEIGQLTDGFNHMLEQVELRDAELRDAKDTAENANQTKSAFLANMSHELRTPMNAILGYSEMLIEDATDAGHEPYVDDLTKILGAGKHLLMLINDVLDLSKIEAGRVELVPEDFELETLLADVTSMAQPLVEQNGNELRSEIAPDLGTLRGDVMRLRQVLFNLISNACKFTEQGKVVITAGTTDGPAGKLVEISINDTGIGMSPEQLERIREFRPFTQADASTTRTFGGTGLGLVISKRFAELMGGDLTVESEEGVGSTFTLRAALLATGAPGPRTSASTAAPAAATAAHAEAASAAAAAATTPAAGKGKGKGKGAKVAGGTPAGGSKGLVLVIDDDQATRDVMARLLSREGFEVRTADGGKDGLRLAAELRPAVITLDVKMPDLSGWDVLTALKADDDLRDIPVVLLTMVDDRSKGIALGASEYLTKPIDRERLFGVLESFRCEQPVNTVLMVDDDPGVREHLGRSVRKAGWKVLEADNGRTALEVLEGEVPNVILLDLMMPVLDGFGFLIELRKRPEWKQIPVVVLTGADLSVEERNQLGGQVELLIEKGARTREELEAEIRALVASCAHPDGTGN